MVPMAGIGPATSPLPRECSTTEPHGPVSTTTGINPIIWSGRRGSNSRHSVWKTEALPTELHPRYSSGAAIHTLLAGLLLAAQANKPYYFTSFLLLYFWWRGKDSNLRTLRERIYSPSPLTTRPPLLTEPAIMLTFQLSVKCSH